MEAKARPEVSVVIPTRDRPEGLRRAVASALAQRGADFEIVVVDDGEGEGAATTLARHFPAERRLACLDNRRRGQVMARNLGVDQARGASLAFLDDDDAWGDPDYLAAAAAALRGAAAATYASGEVVVGAGERTLPFAAHSDPDSIRKDNRILVSGFAFNRGARARVGAFDPAFPYYWDWDFYLRLHGAGVPFRDLGERRIRIHADPDSVSASRNRAERADNLALLARKHALSSLVLRNHLSIAEDEAQALAGRDDPAG